jgi:hypothetical protein
MEAVTQGRSAVSVPSVLGLPRACREAAIHGTIPTRQSGAAHRNQLDTTSVVRAGPNSYRQDSANRAIVDKHWARWRRGATLLALSGTSPHLDNSLLPTATLVGNAYTYMYYGNLNNNNNNNNNNNIFLIYSFHRTSLLLIEYSLSGLVR